MLRIINEDYYDLLRLVQKPPEGASELVADLKIRARLVSQTDQPKARAKVQGISFAEQMQILRLKFPNGFADEAWLKSIRGAGASRRLKRHRQPAINDMSGELTDEALQQALDDGRSAGVVEGMARALARTNLLKASELTPLRDLSAGQAAQYVTALRELLFGDAELEQRFEQLVAAHGRGGSWPLLTAPAALARPDSMICVRPTMIRRQAQVLEPTLGFGTVPTGRVYGRLVAMAKRAREMLTEASLPPADLMDVFDFMGITLVPSARKLLRS
jgi:hypothetical protein